MSSAFIASESAIINRKRERTAELEHADDTSDSSFIVATAPMKPCVKSTVIKPPSVEVGMLFTQGVGSDSYGFKVLSVSCKGLSLCLDATKVTNEGRTFAERDQDSLSAARDRELAVIARRKAAGKPGGDEILDLSQYTSTVTDTVHTFHWRPRSGRWVTLKPSGKEVPSYRRQGEVLHFGSACTVVDPSF